MPKWCWQNEHYRINLLLVSLLPMLPVLQFASKFFELTTISCTLQQFPTLLAFVGSFPVSRFHLSFCYCCALRSVLPATARRAALCTALRRAPCAASSPEGPPLRAAMAPRGPSPNSRRRTSAVCRRPGAARGRLPQGAAAAECGVAAPGFGAGPASLAASARRGGRVLHRGGRVRRLAVLLELERLGQNENGMNV